MVLEEAAMATPHMQSVDTGRDRSRRAATIQDLAVDLGGPSLRERGGGSQWFVVAVGAASLVFWFLLHV